MTTPGYWDRYQAGDHIQVWSELIQLGDAALTEPIRSQSLMVCNEIVRRARSNLWTLHGRLLELGYEFANPHAALVDSDDTSVAELQQIEQDFGKLPLIANVWYHTVASVDFEQAKNQLRYPDAVRAPAAPVIFGLGSHNVLVFLSMERCRHNHWWLAARGHENEDLNDEDQLRRQPYSPELGPFLPSGGWASNCEPKGFDLPCHSVDGVLFNDGGGDIYFVDQLRMAFQWGGFPFWSWVRRKPDFYSPFEYRPDFAKLLPLLKDGLLEL